MSLWREDEVLGEHRGGASNLAWSRMGKVVRGGFPEEVAGTLRQEG